MDSMRPGLPQPVHTDSDGEGKQRAGGRERNRRGNEYLTVTHGVKERNVSLADLLVFFIPPFSAPPPQPSSSTPHLHSMPIEICKHNSLGNRIKRFMKESAFGLGFAVVSHVEDHQKKKKDLCYEVKLELSPETMRPQREKDAEEKLSERGQKYACTQYSVISGLMMECC